MSSESQFPKLSMSTREAAQALGVREAAIRRLIIEKRLPALRIGWKWLIPVAELERLVREGIEAEPRTMPRLARDPSRPVGRPRKHARRAP